MKTEFQDLRPYFDSNKTEPVSGKYSIQKKNSLCSMELSRGGLFESDLNDVLIGVGETWARFSGAKIVIFGGTGFVGTWLVAALLHANQQLKLGIDLTIASRNVKKALEKLNLYQGDPVTFIELDLRSDKPFDFGSADYYVHAATPSVSTTGSSDIELVTATTVGGARNILSHIQRHPSNPSFLHTSSGAVYGPQPLDLAERLEEDPSDANALVSHYARAKLTAEGMVRTATEDGLIKGSNPRLFAFLGPHVAIDQHFAIGNFMKDGLEGRKIRVNGNPRTVRSYLYPSDLTGWLIKLMAEPHIDAINFGSEQSYTVLELAHLVSVMTSNRGVDLLNPNLPASRYVPSTEKARDLLGVEQKIFLSEGIERWIKWLSATQK